MLNKMITTEKEAFRFVLNELLTCDLFRGHYDAQNGNENFMYGISSVMESIAYHVDDDTANAFSDLFTKNLVESLGKAKTFDIDFSATVHVKAKTVEEAYDKFYGWLEQIPTSRELQVSSVCVDDDQLRPTEDLIAE